MNNIRKLTDSLFWVGVNDRRIALFENVYPVPTGMSYNSYVLLDEKTALFDTVDASFTHDFLENVTAALNGRTLDYLIVNHMEPDHCASIADVIAAYPEAKIVCTAKAVGMMKQFFDFDIDSRAVIVKEGDTLSTGKHNLTFVMAPMVHWPEVMVAYEQSEKILFSADGFGKFGALDVEEEWDEEAARYFLNIVGKYGVQVQGLLKKASGLDIQMICPLHGPILKENLGYYIDKYQTWSTYQPEKHGVMVAYASIHGNTAQAAEEMAELLRANGEEVEVFDLSRTDVSLAVRKAFYYDRLVLAAATYDGGVFPCMEEFLLHLRSKNFQKRTVGLIENGSWAPLAAKVIKEMMAPCKKIDWLKNNVHIWSAVKEENRKEIEKRFACRLYRIPTSVDAFRITHEKILCFETLLSER